MRHAADILRHEPGVGQQQRGAEVADLVDHHVVGGAMEIGCHLGRDRGQGAADDFQGHGVELRRHWACPTLMMSSPVSATASLSPGKITVVEAYSLTSAGPSILSPGFNFSRS